MDTTRNSLNIMITEWNKLDNKLQEYNNIVKNVKTQKDTLEKRILTVMNSSKVSELKFNNEKYKIANDNTYTNLSYKYLKSKLLELFKDEKKVDSIIIYLKSERDKKQAKILKKGKN